MLELDSDKRITATQALAHQYLAQYSDPSDEPESALYDQTFEDYDLPVDKWRGINFFIKFYIRRNLIVIIFPELVYEEVTSFVPPVTGQLETDNGES